MISKEQLEQASYMWTTKKDDYVLVPIGKAEDGSVQYAIEDHTINHAVIIEDEELASEVKRRMLLGGVLVGDPRDIEFRKLLIRRRLGRP